MFLNTLDVKLNIRPEELAPRVELNENTLAILTLISEFKLLSNAHVSRFLTGEDSSKYLYRKLRMMWQAELLESFKVFSSSNIGGVIYFVLAKKGLDVLLDNNLITKLQIKNYPKAKSLLSFGLFKHEAQIAELASIESKLNNKGLILSFLGEANSKSFDDKDDKTIESLSPDYIVFYEKGQIKQMVFTEFERTKKSFQAMESKLNKYTSFFSGRDMGNKTLRLVFQTPEMEKSFWLNTILNQPKALSLNIVTTNIELIKNEADFLKDIYANESSANLTKDSRLSLEILARVKLFNFLGSDP